MTRKTKILVALAMLACISLGGFLNRVPLAYAATQVELWLAGSAVSASNPMPVTCTSGCTGGGGATSTAINDGTVPAQLATVGVNGGLVVQGVAGGTAIPVSNASLPLPTGAATAAKQPALGTAGAASTDVITVQGIASGTAQPVSAASLPLPTGAATSANQPGIGTAGSANPNVLTVQGVASMTKLLVTPDSVALPANQSVNTAQVNGVTALTGSGAVGTGAQRIAVGTDTATIAGSAPGTSGTPSANVVSVQGVAGGTAQPISAASLPLPTGAALDATLSGTIAAGTNVANPAKEIMQGCLFETSPGTITTGNAGQVHCDNLGYPFADLNKINGSSAATAASGVLKVGVVGNAGAALDAVIGTAPTNAIGAAPMPTTSGGLSTCFLQATASTNATNCKNAAGQVYHIRATNNSNVIAYLRLYNLSAAPTCTSATGLQDEIVVPGPAAGGGGFIADIALGETFSTGIGFCFSGGIASTDNTSVAANAFLITILYK